MRCPTLTELPPSPSGKTGWPWTVESPQLPDTMPDGKPWPRISIVTPSYNQGEFIEETIRSLLLQGYPDLEYIIMDGGSSDESVAIIEKYTSWLVHWVSEKDDGQADAINKGLAHCTGTVFQWINSDDFLHPLALKNVGLQILSSDGVAGIVLDFYETGCRVKRRNRGLEPINFARRPSEFMYHQPGVWLRAEHVRALGGFDPNFRYKFDWELTVRYLERWPRLIYVEDVLVYFRRHNNSKSGSEMERFGPEELVAMGFLTKRLKTRELRSVFIARIKKLNWWLRVDELRNDMISPKSRLLFKLVAEAFVDPLNRIDRYSLGAARLIMARD